MSSKKPRFFIIAGPNGSGKSTISKNLLEDYKTEAFDWDQEFYSRWAKFHYDPLVIEGIRESANSAFEKAYNDSINKGKSFAYETNFHSQTHIELLKCFNKAGSSILKLHP